MQDRRQMMPRRFELNGCTHRAGVPGVWLAGVLWLEHYVGLRRHLMLPRVVENDRLVVSL